jgi:SAM-dependent methyltransferase
VLNKLKKIFMKKEQIGEMRIPTDELQKEVEALEESEAAAENIDAVSEPTNESEELTQIEPTTKEKQDINDVGYLENSPTAVGFVTQEEQYNTYASIINIIPEDMSVLDFGCGRGDLFDWYNQTFKDIKLDYTGIDANKALIDIGKKLYNGINLINEDWNNLSEENDKRDWCINIGSNKLRYDFNTNKSNDDYLFDTIEKMYSLCNDGMLIVLASNMSDDESSAIKCDPGLVFNWAQSRFGNVVIDHTDSDGQFILIIYKN